MGLAWVAWMLLDLATRVAAGWRRLGPTEEGQLLIAAGAACLAAVAHGLIDNFYFLIDLAFAWWLLLALVAVTTGAAPDEDGAKV